jgi:hypothetical protein
MLSNVFGHHRNPKDIRDWLDVCLGAGTKPKSLIGGLKRRESRGEGEWGVGQKKIWAGEGPMGLK